MGLFLGVRTILLGPRRRLWLLLPLALAAFIFPLDTAMFFFLMGIGGVNGQMP